MRTGHHARGQGHTKADRAAASALHSPVLEPTPSTQAACPNSRSLRREPTLPPLCQPSSIIKQLSSAWQLREKDCPLRGGPAFSRASSHLMWATRRWQHHLPPLGTDGLQPGSAQPHGRCCPPGRHQRPLPAAPEPLWAPSLSPPSKESSFQSLSGLLPPATCEPLPSSPHSPSFRPLTQPGLGVNVPLDNYGPAEGSGPPGA